MSLEQPQDNNVEKAKDNKPKKSFFDGKVGKLARLVTFASAITGAGYGANKYSENIKDEVGKIENSIDELYKQKQLERYHQIETVIVKKNYIPNDNILSPRGNIPVLEQWRLVFITQKGELEMNVSKEQYENNQIGDKVVLKYHIPVSGVYDEIEIKNI